MVDVRWPSRGTGSASLEPRGTFGGLKWSKYPFLKKSPAGHENKVFPESLGISPKAFTLNNTKDLRPAAYGFGRLFFSVS